MNFRNNQIKDFVLRHLTSNLMIADNNFNIIYINEALKSLFTDKTQDLQKMFPDFSLENLVGQNIDVFHKTPSHQRQVLAGINNTFKASIDIGDTTFDLVAMPITNSSGKRLGTFVEWHDASLRLFIEDAKAQTEAISKSQAVIRFDPTGNIIDCNENFLQAMGYSKAELIGTHHRQFVDPDYANSQEYTEFWRRLGHGEFQSGQYQRFDKQGNKIWLQATYNPLFDAEGHVKNVIKFASDITEETERRQRANEAQKSIASDLQGIATSVSFANEQARKVSTISQSASGNVQSVSAGIEELVASVKEINRQASTAKDISNNAVIQADTTNDIVSKMSNAAQEIANVVNLISDIAEQTNLLALNATIEAARAGEAGKGFSVVASEVKELASQTSKATDEISSRIENVQNTSVEAVRAIEEISETIKQISDISEAISSSVDQQSMTMGDMSSNMQVASDGVQNIDTGMQDIANSITSIDDATQKVKEASSTLT